MSGRMIFVACLFRSPICPPEGQIPDNMGECVGAFADLDKAQEAVLNAAHVTADRYGKPIAWTPEEDLDSIGTIFLHRGGYLYFGRVDQVTFERRESDRRRK